MGINVIDSRYRSELFFWINDESLIFKSKRDINEPQKAVGYFVWNTQTNTVKPLIIEGRAIGYYDGQLAEGRFSDTEVYRDGSRKVDIFLSTLKEMDDKWILENTKSMKDSIDPPPDRYELTWVAGGKPRYRLKENLRSEDDPPQHGFDYLWEWGWIMRTPAIGPEHYGQTNPEMGFFDLGGEIYADQPGRKVAELIEVSPNDVMGLVVTYVGFLDRYWIANTYSLGDTKAKLMGFLGSDGKFKRIKWYRDWRDYMDSPLPTKKGLFWYGPDYRLADPTWGDRAGFVRSGDGQISKVVQGLVLYALVSGDGCRVAFFNKPRIDRPGASLKLVNVCTSTKDGRVLSDDAY